ncbi:translation initiation factor IF-2 [Methylobacterium symbioticum]|uniref:translation initiation factor IF-2 n=1 Tax=uncultured Methylobacterium sp. TaxID=157278 RepID=UPI002593D5FE|nr:translation initiation factor IF-2 [uncultured Methylobacterium sp.]
MFRPVSRAALLGLSLLGLAQVPSAQAESAPAVRSPQAVPAEARPAPRAERPARRPRNAARAPREHRAVAYPGGRGASWKTGQDSYGFAGSFGGCRFRGNAGPNGYQLDRTC